MSLVALSALVLVSFGVEAAAGFGSMVVALTVGALFMPVDALLGVLVPVNLALSVYLVVRGRAFVDWRFLGTGLVPLMALGLGVGTALTRVIDATWAKPVFACFVMAVAASQLKQALSTAAPRELSAPVRLGGLVGAGVVHGLFATGGPLAVYVAGRALADKHAFRATLSMLWVVMNVLVLPRLVNDGQLTGATLGTSALLVVPLAVGIMVGEQVHRALDERRFRVAVAALLLAASVVLLAGSVPGAAR